MWIVPEFFDSLVFFQFSRILANSFEFPTILLDCVRILSDSPRVFSNSCEFSCILCEFCRILLDSLIFFEFSRVLSNPSGFSRIPKNSSRIFANCVEFLLFLSGSIGFSLNSLALFRIHLDSPGFSQNLSNSPVIFRIVSNSLGVSDSFGFIGFSRIFSFSLGLFCFLPYSFESSRIFFYSPKTFRLSHIFRIRTVSFGFFPILADRPRIL